MSILDLFWQTPKPGWMSRERGRKFAEVCFVAYDSMVEGLFQGRFNFFGYDPHPSAIPRIARDVGIVPGIAETARDYMLRRRRQRWTWRAAGLPGVADAVVNKDSWGNRIPYKISGRPTEEGFILNVLGSGVINTSAVTYEYSTDGGVTFLGPFGTSSTSDFTFGDLTIYFETGDVWTMGDTLVINHGGRGLRLNDLGAPVRAVAASSPAGDESLLHEIAMVIGAPYPRIRLADATGTWWTLEEDGTVWRLPNGPWAWNATLDADPEYWSRGLIIIDNPPGIDPWELLSANMHYLGEPQASFGTTATMEWWNRLAVTIGNFRPGNFLVHSVILNFDSTKFDPSVSATCPQGDWYNPHKDDGFGNIVPSRPIEYAWFSGPM